VIPVDFCRSGQLVTHRQEPIEKSDFLKSLDEESECGTSEDYPLQASVSGTAETHSEAARERNLVQSLDNSVQFWTDYLKSYLHPRSVYELPNTWHGVTDFENYASGQGFFKEQEQREEIENRLRFFVEECDHLQVSLV
jgi:hypothetical protein